MTHHCVRPGGNHSLCRVDSDVGRCKGIFLKGFKNDIETERRPQISRDKNIVGQRRPAKATVKPGYHIDGDKGHLGDRLYELLTFLFFAGWAGGKAPF